MQSQIIPVQPDAPVYLDCVVIEGSLLAIEKGEGAQVALDSKGHDLLVRQPCLQLSIPPRPLLTPANVVSSYHASQTSPAGSSRQLPIARPTASARQLTLKLPHPLSILSRHALLMDSECTTTLFLLKSAHLMMLQQKMQPLKSSASMRYSSLACTATASTHLSGHGLLQTDASSSVRPPTHLRNRSDLSPERYDCHAAISLIHTKRR